MPELGKKGIFAWSVAAAHIVSPLLALAADDAGQGRALETMSGALPAGGDTATLLTIIFKTAGALALVVGLLVFALLALRKAGLGTSGGNRAGLITILDSKMIAPKKHITVVKVGGEHLVLGVTEERITFLTKLSVDEVVQASMTKPVAAKQTISSSFPSFLRKAIGKEVEESGRL